MTTVYTKNNCRPCEATKRWLTKHGLTFVEINLDEHPEARDQLVARGFMESPVVDSPIGTWSGFRPDLIDLLAKETG
ncbi:NrdH-redoxin [Herbiconiux moechotypicola]|uniref:Glutaredoxin family protein n=1 Tax=Herbiconiux moechotypicola TaxID=637393 RepID=A0ABP5QDP9_9MICO|nr:glutaredoxin domain-containing protein [Herbiconiux moechotypicola]MCS5729514.1 NrdH-redoxin [Herbiconiux moechotypicola]